jgi:hypothetical protein
VTQRPRNPARILFLWLSLVTMLTCALGSFGSPVRASSGSAFNAFTSDVTLGPSRAAAPTKENRQATPTGGAGQASPASSLSLILAPAHSRGQPVQAGPFPLPAAVFTAGPLIGRGSP